jgi:hypothetical protein
MSCKMCYINKVLSINNVYHRHTDRMEDDVGIIFIS